MQFACLSCMMFWTVFGLWSDLSADGLVLNSASYRIGWSDLADLDRSIVNQSTCHSDTISVFLLQEPWQRMCGAYFLPRLYWMSVYI